MPSTETHVPLPSTQNNNSPEVMHILLINPNSTPSMTKACIESVKPILPPYVKVTGFTAPRPAPSAIEGASDSVISTSVSLSALRPTLRANEHQAYLVACFSAHPLIPVLREETERPVIGIMEAALYTARMLGSRFGIVATGRRSVFMHEDAVRGYGLSAFCVGVEALGLGVLDLEREPREEVLRQVEWVAEKLAKNGADVILLGCAGMTDFVDRCESAVGYNGKVQVVDGVRAGVQMLYGLVMGRWGTAKGGAYASATNVRIGRGQNWE
ncbi:MAG: hypothetical protein M1820_002389 [Bogoriella megaspora]|nr:MAG: hypothetical protein M1820_002389 [Bogoriella megaspora]